MDAEFVSYIFQKMNLDKCLAPIGLERKAPACTTQEERCRTDLEERPLKIWPEQWESTWQAEQAQAQALGWIPSRPPVISDLEDGEAEITQNETHR